MKKKVETKEQGPGPVVYENWKAANSGAQSIGAQEFPLYTDANITGTMTIGPYKFFLTHYHHFAGRYDALRPAIILRVENHLDILPVLKMPMDKTDDRRYHGGWLKDEVAALVSLSLGIRLKAGDLSRRFEPYGDPRGVPDISLNEPVLLEGSGLPIIPSAPGHHSLCDTKQLATLVELSPLEAAAFIRAARLYQDALWISESEPHLSWIMLVSAVETAASCWPLDSKQPSKKFVHFVLNFMPEPPSARPGKGAQLSWVKTDMKEALGRVYGHRSNALHYGTPFPLPMCEPPGRFDDLEGWYAPDEIPSGLATRFGTETWLAKDTPMLLHTFEYLVRNSLLKWVESMASPKPVPGEDL